MEQEKLDAQMRSIAAELRSEAAKQGLTYKAVADRAEMQLMTVSRYMRGQRDIPMSKLIAMCDAIGISINDLLAQALDK